MSSPSERIAAGLAATTLIALVALGAALLPRRSSAAEEPVRPANAAVFQVRCWQYGRLLFEQRDVRLPNELPAGLKLHGFDRNRQPVYITDTGNATCLIRSVATPKP